MFKSEDRRFDHLWLAGWLLFTTVYCLSASWRIGATFDEPIYLTEGLNRWHTGSCDKLMAMGTMPLPVDLCTLPLYLTERIRGQRFDLLNDLPALLPWARATALIFWWLVLVYGWLLGRELAGPWGGRWAVVLLALEPSLLAHAGLATTDMAITACLLMLAYHFRRGRESSWPWRVGLPALLYGLGLLAKASGLLFGPFCLFVMEIDRLARQGAFATGSNVPLRERIGHWLTRIKPFVVELTTIVALGLVLMFVYVGSDWETEPDFVKWAHEELPAGHFADAMILLSENLKIFSNAGEGIVQQIKHNIRGHDVYLFGERYDRAIWYYFPVALAVKLSVLLLLTPLFLALFRPSSLLNAALAITAALLLFSLTCRVQIGIRLILPLIAFLAIGLGAAIAHAAQRTSAWRRSVVVGWVGAGCVWSVIMVCLTWPNALCYSNEFWGGPATTYRQLSDSNCDWGQGLPELAQWTRDRKLAGIDVWYFGKDPAIGQTPFCEAPLHRMAPEQWQERVAGRKLAVSTTFLYGSYGQGMIPQAAAWLRQFEPVDRTTTFMIFDFTRPEATAAAQPPAANRLR